MILRRVTVLVLLLACVVGEAEAALTRTCDAAASSEPGTAPLPALSSGEESPSSAPGTDEDACQCAHPHASARPRADRLAFVPIPVADVPRDVTDRRPASADRSLPLRPPRA